MFNLSFEFKDGFLKIHGTWLLKAFNMPIFIRNRLSQM